MPRGFTVWVIRESGFTRRNKPSFHIDPDFGRLIDVVEVGVWDDPAPGTLGYFNSSVWTGDGEWPDVIPFTGYIDLAIETAAGRAVSDTGTLSRWRTPARRWN